MRVVMCEPKYFDVPCEYKEKNPWMNVSRRPDSACALKQWKELRDFYIQSGVRVAYIEPRGSIGAIEKELELKPTFFSIQGLFDQVFTANIAFGIDNTWVMGNLAPWWRKLETVYAAEFLVRERKSVFYLPEHMIFEGQGDLVHIGRGQYCYCYGIRNTYTTRWELEYVFPTIRKMPMRLVDTRWYHGDMCIRYLAVCNTILWIPQAFDKKSRNQLRTYATLSQTNLLPAPKKLWFQETRQGINFPVNGVSVGNIETFPWDENVSTFPKKIRGCIEECGGKIWLHNFDQFGLSGAGHRCATLVIEK